MHISKNAIVVIIIALLTSLSFSVQWLLPTIYEHTYARDSGYKYVPLRYAPYVIERDTYYYYSYVREIIDNGVFSGDPLTYENKGKRTISYSYIGSLVLGSIGGILTNRTEYAYYFNNLVFPAINFVLIYMLYTGITGFRYGSILLAQITMLVKVDFLNPAGIRSLFSTILDVPNGSILDSNDLARMPNIMITNVHLLLFVYLLLKRSNSMKSKMLLWLVLASSPLISVQNNLVVFCIVFCMFVKSIAGNGISRETKEWLFGLVILFPTLIYAYVVNSQMQAVNIPFSGSDLSYYTKPNIVFLFLHSVLLIGSGMYYFKNRSILRADLLAVIAALFVCSVALFALSGSFAVIETFGRGYIILYYVIVLSAAVLALRQVWVRLLRHRIAHVQPAVRVLIVTAGVCLVTWSCYNQVEVYAGKVRFYDARPFYELCEWSRHNTTGKDVAVTLDYDLLINMPIYSPLNFYVPQAVLSPTSSEERYDRFFEIARLYGMNGAELKSRLRSMKSISLEPDADNKYAILMNMVLFYRKYIYKDISENDMADFVGAFERHKSSGGLKYRADYVIVSDYDAKLIEHNSALDSELQGLAKVFSNSQYRVYRMSNPSGTNRIGLRL